jgi:predicted Zn finger-like uncharacterized protein
MMGTAGVAKDVDVVYSVTMATCPACAQTRYQTKAGLTGAGSQRVRCGACGKRYTAQPKWRGYDPALRTQAVKLYVDGMHFRRIARQLDVQHQRVINWVNAAADALPDAPPVPEQVDTVEVDAVYTFVRRKKTGSTS